MQAIKIGKFEEVGIIVDLTTSLIRRRRIPVALQNVSDCQQVDNFVTWMEDTAKVPKLSFWETNAQEMTA
jgi:hypothetical protein